MFRVAVVLVLVSVLVLAEEEHETKVVEDLDEDYRYDAAPAIPVYEGEEDYEVKEEAEEAEEENIDHQTTPDPENDENRSAVKVNASQTKPL